MSNNSPSFLLTILTTVIVLGFPSQSDAQVQEVIWEKSYCLDERGTVIRFDHRAGTMPPFGKVQSGVGIVVGDTERLYSLSPRTAQFLFTRACLEAASTNLGKKSSESLECRADRFLARRFNMSPHETLQIIEELSLDSSMVKIARELKFCL